MIEHNKFDSIPNTDRIYYLIWILVITSMAYFGFRDGLRILRKKKNQLLKNKTEFQIKLKGQIKFNEFIYIFISPLILKKKFYYLAFWFLTMFFINGLPTLSENIPIQKPLFYFFIFASFIGGIIISIMSLKSIYKSNPIMSNISEYTLTNHGIFIINGDSKMEFKWNFYKKSYLLSRYVVFPLGSYNSLVLKKNWFQKNDWDFFNQFLKSNFPEIIV
jgi:hypothetical protein